MLSYSELHKDRRKFLAMTGYTLEEFQALLPHFEAQFEHHMAIHALDGKPRAPQTRLQQLPELPLTND